MKEIRAIGFDLFNTLIKANRNTLEEAMGLLIKSLEMDGFAEDHSIFNEDYGKAAAWHIEQSRKSGKETHNRFWICDALNRAGHHLSPDDPRIARGVDAYFSAFYPNCSMMPGALEILRTLQHRYPLGLLSNFTHPPAVWKIIEDLGLRSFFKTVIISGEIGYRKPDPAAFSALVGQLGVESGKVLFVGDDPEADIYGAGKAGLHPIYMTYARDRNLPFASGMFFVKDEAITDHIPRISTPEELLHLLNGYHSGT
ncbi:MAG: hypothetical protein A2V65_00545 [Deltaproteobacteria bacterium RBG_13_49_15]|nr:MAG: hypothetical protein A2V65_00545 [Deltaproteobacteria bacterium RBG_13_49_15]